MTDPTKPPGKLEADLHRIAQLLREARHLDPEAQRALAALVDDLAGAVRAPSSAEPGAADVAASATHLMDALVKPHDPGVLAAARDRLERAVMNAEAQAPLASGLAQRLLEILAGIGI